ncbi:hypothetical protein FIBSPDRAFT_847332 [Athelia psychrophila]|uniref:Uncharacterized protein n=1 Tax=Athelia psychrophila TaxID=1759441 RepID=A0A166W613_9AGAM|nr:hypothetical protein FIBSPDRAFT_847332 [Fibularhizoctonia sp. CBS 109695]
MEQNDASLQYSLIQDWLINMTHSCNGLVCLCMPATGVLQRLAASSRRYRTGPTCWIGWVSNDCQQSCLMTEMYDPDGPTGKSEQDRRTYGEGTLSRTCNFGLCARCAYIDSTLGTRPTRTHAAEQPFRAILTNDVRFRAPSTTALLVAFPQYHIHPSTTETFA